MYLHNDIYLFILVQRPDVKNDFLCGKVEHVYYTK